MRTLVLVIWIACLAPTVMALELSAGQNLGASQVGIDSKLSASNALLMSGAELILNCNHTNQLFDSSTNTCKPPVDPAMIKKMAECNAAKQFYSETTGDCQSLAVPPDLTTQTNSNTALANAILNCNKNLQFYNSSTNACMSASGGTLKFGAVKAYQGGYGALVNCPAGYVVTSVCTSGEDADCHQAGSAWTYMKCTQLTVQ